MVVDQATNNNLKLVSHFVAKPKTIGLEFWIAKLTNSIENTISGEVFDTVITLVGPNENKQLKRKDWSFNWTVKLNEQDRQIYKLTTVQNPGIIQGLN